MTNFNFAKVPSSSSPKNDWWKAKEGDNRIRILTDGEKYPEHNRFDKNFENGDYVGICVGKEKGCPACLSGRLTPSVKYLFWILDNEDGTIKLAKLTYGIVSQLSELLKDPDWAFEEMPMPYDVNIRYTESAAPANKYKLIPSPKRTPVTETVLQAISDKKSPREIIEAISAKATKVPVTITPANSDPMKPAFDSTNYPNEDISPDDIPF